MNYFYDDNNPTNNITVVTADYSNIQCQEITVYQDANVQGNLQLAQNIVATETIFCNSLNAQSYYTQAIIASSNIISNGNINLSGQLLHPKVSVVNGSNYIQNIPIVTTSNGSPGVPWSVVLGAPSNLNDTNWLQQTGAFASTAATLAALGTNVFDKLKAAYSPYSALSNPLSLDETSRIADTLNGSNAAGGQMMVNLQRNVFYRYFAQDGINFAYPNNIVIGTLGKIMYDNDSTFGFANQQTSYTPQSQQVMIDPASRSLYLDNLSNVKKLDLGVWSLSNDGTARRSITNSNGIFFDGVKFFQQNVSSIQSLTSSNVITPNVIGLTNSNIIFNALTSNSGVTTSNLFSMSPAGVFTAPSILNAPSNFANYSQVSTISNLQLNGSNASFCNLTAGTIQSGQFGISNGIFTINGDLNVNGVLRFNWADVCPTGLTGSSLTGVNTGKDPGMYWQGYQVFDKNGQLKNTPLNEQAAYMGSKLYDTIKADARITANNPFKF